MGRKRKANFIPGALTTVTDQLFTGQSVASGIKTGIKAYKGKRGNPIESAPQWGLMQAVAHGTAKVKGVTKAVAKKFIKETPKEDRSRFARELKKNPEMDAEALSEMWHGRKVKKVTDIEETETFSEDVADLGPIEEIGVLGPDNYEKFCIRFSRDQPHLCTSDGENLEVVGGDQHINISDVGVEKDGKRLVPLGYSYSIVYWADKQHLEGGSKQADPWEHYWGEEFYKDEGVDRGDYRGGDGYFEAVQSEGIHLDAIEDGILPMVVYNKTDDKILLVGGKYKVKDVGIVN